MILKKSFSFYFHFLELFNKLLFIKKYQNKNLQKKLYKNKTLLFSLHKNVYDGISFFNRGSIQRDGLF